MAAFALVAHWLACIWYAIGYAERSGPKAHIGWLASLANATDQPYMANNTGGPSIKVSFFFSSFIIELYSENLKGIKGTEKEK